MPTLNTRLRLVTIGIPVLLTDLGLACVPVLVVAALVPVLVVAALAPLLDRESWTLGTWLRGLLLVRSVSLDNFRITISRRWGGVPFSSHQRTELPNLGLPYQIRHRKKIRPSPRLQKEPSNDPG